MDFGTLMKTAFSDPKPSYEFTRMKMVWVINEYISGSLRKNLLRPHFGISAMAEFPPASPVPYNFPPDMGAQCAAISACVPGKVTIQEYDSVAKASQEVGTFWGNFFELIGRCLLRSTITFMPLIPDEVHPDNFSTPMPYNSVTMSTNGSFYLTTGNVFSASRILADWRKAGDDLFDSIKGLEIKDPEILRTHISNAVRAAATRASTLWRFYNGAIKPSGMTPGTLSGYIYGPIKFD